MERVILIGRAGTGKTKRLLDRVATFLAEGRERDALLLVPNLSQASHLKRLLLTRHEELTGFFDETVVTFTGLAERLLADRPIGEVLSGLRQDLLLRRALAASPVAEFRRLAAYPGFRAAAKTFLKELKQNGLPPGAIAEELRRMAADREGVVGRRLDGFRALLAEYERLRRAAGQEDHEDYLRRARDRLAAGGGRRLEYVGVDGFQNFTRLEREILLLLPADHLLVTLPFDTALPAGDARQFRVSAETLAFLRGAGFREEVLRENRRARSASLVRIERSLFDPDAGREAPDGAVRMLEAADPDDEADRVARTVLRLVTGAEGEARALREIVIVVRDAASVRERFERAFRRHGIPLRAYAAAPLAGHPLVRSTLDLLRVAAGDLSRGRLLSLLRSDHLAGVRPEEIDRLEHDLLEAGDPAGPGDWPARVGGFSRAGGDLLRALAGAAWARNRLPAAALAREIEAALAAHLAPLWTKPDALRDDGPAAADRIRREARAFGVVREAVREVADALAPGGETDLAAFLPLLSEALRSARAAGDDRRLDVVNLIDAEEARQWEAPVVVVSGLVEGEFPRSPREDVFLSDRDRERENREGGLALRERLLEREEERFLFYVAMTRARDRLYLTWPSTDGRGEETLSSLYLEEVLSLFTDAPTLFLPEGLVSRHRLSEPLPREEEIADREDLRRAALLGLSEPFRAGTGEEARARRAAALHDLLLGAGEGEPDADYARAVRIGERFLRPPGAVLLDPSAMPPVRGLSASALEDFVACPFKHFAGRTLRLSPPPRAAAEGLDPRLLGEIAHEVLRLALLDLGEGGDPPGPETVLGIFREVFREKAAGAPPGLVAARSREALRDTLVAVVAREVERLAAGRRVPAHLEAPFRFLLGGEVPVVGKVDRIDADPGEGPGRGGVVIDYKHGKRGFDGRRRAEAEEGAHLQLPIYLLALREAFGLRPEGAFLYPLRAPSLSGYSLAGSPEAEEGLSAEEMEALLDRTRARVLELAGRIAAGEIEVRPREPDRCKRCDYGDLCRFESWQAAAGGRG